MDIGALGVYACLFFALYFEVFLLISFLERKPVSKTPARPNNYPTVSMMVPCWNEERTVGKTIESLLALDYPKEKLEILVIDDGSTDRTAEIAQEYVRQFPQVKLFSKPNGGKYTALNWGIQHSTSELLGCLDADSFVAPDGLIEMVKTFESDPAIMAVTPAMKVSHPHNILELMQSVEYTFGIFYKKIFDNLSAVNVLPGPFSMYRREAFRRVGLFRHAHNTEDMEIAFRLHAHGLKIANAHTAIVYTTVPQTTRALIKQRTRWSQGFLQNSKDYYYMYFNPRYGHFGMLVLPFGLIAFIAGLYSACYALYTGINFAVSKMLSFWVAGIPVHAPTIVLNWFYINTSMLTFLIGTTLSLTIVAILMGGRMSDTKITLRSYFTYFVLFGLIAPLWLVRALWGTLRAQESSWR